MFNVCYILGDGVLSLKRYFGELYCVVDMNGFFILWLVELFLFLKGCFNLCVMLRLIRIRLLKLGDMWMFLGLMFWWIILSFFRYVIVVISFLISWGIWGLGICFKIVFNCGYLVNFMMMKVVFFVFLIVKILIRFG